MQSDDGRQGCDVNRVRIDCVTSVLPPLIYPHPAADCPCPGVGGFVSGVWRMIFNVLR